MDITAFVASQDGEPDVSGGQAVELVQDDLRYVIAGAIAVVRHVFMLAILVAAAAMCVVIYSFLLSWLCLLWLQTRLFFLTSSMLRRCLDQPQQKEAADLVTPEKPLASSMASQESREVERELRQHVKADEDRVADSHATRDLVHAGSIVPQQDVQEWLDSTEDGTILQNGAHMRPAAPTTAPLVTKPVQNPVKETTFQTRGLVAKPKTATEHRSRGQLGTLASAQKQPAATPVAKKISKEEQKAQEHMAWMERLTSGSAERHKPDSPPVTNRASRTLPASRTQGQDYSLEDQLREAREFMASATRGGQKNRPHKPAVKPVVKPVIKPVTNYGARKPAGQAHAQTQLVKRHTGQELPYSGSKGEDTSNTRTSSENSSSQAPKAAPLPPHLRRATEAHAQLAVAAGSPSNAPEASIAPQSQSGVEKEDDESQIVVHTAMPSSDLETGAIKDEKENCQPSAQESHHTIAPEQPIKPNYYEETPAVTSPTPRSISTTLLKSFRNVSKSVSPPQEAQLRTSDVGRPSILTRKAPPLDERFLVMDSATTPPRKSMPSSEHSSPDEKESEQPAESSPVQENDSTGETLSLASEVYQAESSAHEDAGLHVGKKTPSKNYQAQAAQNSCSTLTPNAPSFFAPSRPSAQPPPADHFPSTTLHSHEPESTFVEAASPNQGYESFLLTEGHSTNAHDPFQASSWPSPSGFPGSTPQQCMTSKSFAPSPIVVRGLPQPHAPYPHQVTSLAPTPVVLQGLPYSGSCFDHQVPFAAPPPGFATGPYSAPPSMASFEPQIAVQSFAYPAAPIEINFRRSTYQTPLNSESNMVPTYQVTSQTAPARRPSAALPILPPSPQAQGSPQPSINAGATQSTRISSAHSLNLAPDPQTSTPPGLDVAQPTRQAAFDALLAGPNQPSSFVQSKTEASVKAGPSSVSALPSRAPDIGTRLGSKKRIEDRAREDKTEMMKSLLAFSQDFKMPGPSRNTKLVDQVPAKANSVDNDVVINVDEIDKEMKAHVDESEKDTVSNSERPKNEETKEIDELENKGTTKVDERSHTQSVKAEKKAGPDDSGTSPQNETDEPLPKLVSREEKKAVREVLKAAWWLREEARKRVKSSFSLEGAKELQRSTRNYHETRDQLISLMSGGTLNEEDAKFFPRYTDMDMSAPRRRPDRPKVSSLVETPEAVAGPEAPDQDRGDHKKRMTEPTKYDPTADDIEELKSKASIAWKLRQQALDYFNHRPNTNVSYSMWKKTGNARLERANNFCRKKREELVAAFPVGLPDDLAAEFPSL